MAKKSNDKGYTPKVQVENKLPETGKTSQQPTDLTEIKQMPRVPDPTPKPDTTLGSQAKETGKLREGSLPRQQIETTKRDGQPTAQKRPRDEAISAPAVQPSRPSLKADVRKSVTVPPGDSSTAEQVERPVGTAEARGSVHAAAESASVVQDTAPTEAPVTKPTQAKEAGGPAKSNELKVAQEMVSRTVSQEVLSEAATDISPAEEPAATPKAQAASTEESLTEAVNVPLEAGEEPVVAPPVAVVVETEELTLAPATGAAAAQESLSAAEIVTAPGVESVREPEEPAKLLEEPRREEPQYIHPPLDNKYLNKEALRHRFLLRQEFKPIICYVGRLEHQKGVHLIRHGIFVALAHGAQFVLLGTSPDAGINAEFWHLKRHFNENPDCHLELDYNEELAHLIYAGSDMLVMPSLYEPCGLTQMIALKYGTVPIVRAVGGLVDTVFDRDHSDRPYHERNGYVFHQADGADLESAMRRAIGLWYSYPEEFRQLVINGMKCDYSWYHSAQHYLNIYEYIRCK